MSKVSIQCLPLSEHEDSDDTDDDVANTLQLTFHWNVVKNDSDDQQNDEWCDCAHKKRGKGMRSLICRRIGEKFLTDVGKKMIKSGRSPTVHCLLYFACMLRAILFDADDTLYEEKHAKIAAETAIAKDVATLMERDIGEMYRRFEAAKNHILKSQKGDPRRNEREQWIQALLQEMDLPVSHTERLVSLYWNRVTEEVRPYADASIVLPILSKQFPLFVLTNEDTQYAKRKLEAAGLLENFREIVSAFEIGAEKPSKKFFDDALSRINFLATEVVMIGNDPRSDIRGANSNGIISIFLRRGPFTQYAFQNDEETPHHIVSDYFELQELIMKISGAT